jgi:hypothetical protein
MFNVTFLIKQSCRNRSFLFRLFIHTLRLLAFRTTVFVHLWRNLMEAVGRVCVDCGVCEDRSGSGRSVDHGKCWEINKISKRAGFESSLILMSVHTKVWRRSFIHYFFQFYFLLKETVAWDIYFIFFSSRNTERDLKFIFLVKISRIWRKREYATWFQQLLTSRDSHSFNL